MKKREEKVIKTVKIQKGAQFYINIPNKIVERMQLEKGETALIEVIDEDTMKIKIVED